MTNPNTIPQFTAATPSQEVQRDSRDYIPMRLTKGRLMIVRPLKYMQEGFKTSHKPDGTDVVFCDIAVLDAIPDTFDEYGQPVPGFPAGHQFRNQAVLQGYLKGTFKRYLGDTLIGTMYLGVATKGKPPMMWQDLAGDPQCQERGRQFFMAHPEFLVPVEANFTPSQPQPVPAGPPAYTQPAQLGYAQPNYGPPPVAPAQNPGYQYQQDPWASQPQPTYNQAAPTAAPVSAQPVSVTPAAAPVTTLDQLKQYSTTNHQGHAQAPEAPF